MKSKIAPQFNRDCKTPTWNEFSWYYYNHFLGFCLTHHLTRCMNIFDNTAAILFASGEESIGQNDCMDQRVDRHHNCNDRCWRPEVRRNIVAPDILFNGQLHNFGGSLANFHFFASRLVNGFAADSVDMIAAENEAEQQGKYLRECSIVAKINRIKVYISFIDNKALPISSVAANEICQRIPCIKNAAAVSLIVVRCVALEVSSARIQNNPPMQKNDRHAYCTQQAGKATHWIQIRQVSLGTVLLHTWLRQSRRLLFII